MSKTRDLKTKIKEVINLSCPSVYDEIAPDKVTFPYVIFNIESIRAYDMENYQLEVNCYDYGTNPANVDELADSIENSLKAYTYINEFMQFRTFLNTRNSIMEEDKKIRRKRLLFDLYYFERRI